MRWGFARRAVAALIGCCVLGATAPIAASAATFQVTGTGDQVDADVGDGSCETTTATCTLRAAIEEANAGSSPDTITFAANFDSGAGAVISPATALPAIAQPATIDGAAAGRCMGAAGVPGPCVGLAVPADQRGIVVDADQVKIEGLAITGAHLGIEIEDGADGATVAGNWIGLGPDGALGANESGIHVGSAQDVTIGGRAPAEANHLNGGSLGITWGPLAPRLTIEGNLIGFDPSGTHMLAPPTKFGIDGDLGSACRCDAARIAFNRIVMSTGEAIREHGGGADILGNTIGGALSSSPLGAGETAIHLDGSHSFGSTVEGNAIVGARHYGLLIENGNNRVMANQISGAGINGIRVRDTEVQARNNLIGEDAPSTENTISDSGAAAIVIVDRALSGNLIGRVSGAGNQGLFIDRGGDGPGNRGEPVSCQLKHCVIPAIEAPGVAFASTTEARGSSKEGGDLIRVYAKASADPGELGVLIGEGFSGRGWSVSYPPQPLGSHIAVTASFLPWGTSELTVAQIGPTPSIRILSGPSGRTATHWAVFRFRASVGTATFRCRLDRGHLLPCESPRVYRHLALGKHVFRVKAVDATGKRLATLAVRRFEVVPRRHRGG